MHVTIPLALIGFAGAMMLLELRRPALSLNLKLRGDLRRELRWLEQYGQAACTIVVGAIVQRFSPDKLPSGHDPLLTLLLAVASASIISALLKRLLGRVRPGREHAGTFTGLHWRHDSDRESFPSSHSAAAMAMSVILARLYPQAAVIFFTLAITCALLRYVRDAHWPSDVLAGVALGYAAGDLAWRVMGTAVS